MDLRTKGFRTHLLTSAATGFALMFSAGSVVAQDQNAADAAVEEIIVKGFRASIENSIATKKANSSIVEAISAEDIGKLPDVSIAESLGRLPGLATQRLDGRAQVLTIRGLGPDLSTALLNGREQVSTGDNRGVEYDQYPSELLSAAVVYKTPDASLIGQGLAGTVDLRTIRPLEKNERILAANARYEFNEDGSLNPDSPSGGIRGSATYVDQFAGDTIGVAVGLAYQSTPTQSERYNAWGYPTVGDGGPFVLGGAKPFIQSNDLDRYGVIGILEYEPNSNFNTSLDLYYSDFKEEQRLRGIEFPLYWSAAQLQPGFTVEDGRVTEGAFSPVHAVVRNDFNRRDAEIFAAGWNTKYSINEDWAVEADLSYSRAERSDVLIESYSGTGYRTTGPADTTSFSTLPNGVTVFTPGINYADTNLIVLTDPQGWGAGSGVVQAGFINAPRTEDELTHLRASVDRSIHSDYLSGIEVGVDFSRRDKDRNFDQNFLTLPGTTVFDGDTLIGGSSAAIPQEALLKKQVGLGFLGVPQQVTYDPLYLLENGIYQQVGVALSSLAVPQEWSIREDVFVGFVKFEVDSTLGSIPVTGNFGTQIVYTDQESSGFEVDTGSVGNARNPTLIPVSGGDKYTRFLPSLNLSFHVSDETVVRFGAARTLARSRMDNLNASFQITTSDSKLTSTNPLDAFFSEETGNPELKPIISNGIDLSVEHYFGGGAGYFALAGFYKDLQDFVNPAETQIIDFSDLIESEIAPADRPNLGTPLGAFKTPTNNGRGNIRGFEATLSLPAEILNEALEGFGLISSLSYTDSKVIFTVNPDPITVPGLSKWVINSTAYFEKEGFQARVSHRYRSKFLAEVAAISASRDLRFAKAESIFDAQVGYSFEQGVLDGLTVTLQANNLTDEPFITFDEGQPRNVRDFQNYGRSYTIGASYSF